MDGILKQETTDVVDTAILLTSSGLFVSGSMDSGQAMPSPLTRVGGMTLFQRAVFTLQRGGISQIWVLAGKEEPALRELLREDSRLQAAVRWLPVREFPPNDPQTWETLADEVSGACMVVGCHTVFSPSLVQQLRHEGAQGKAVVVVGHSDEGYHLGNPSVVVRPEGLEGRNASSVVFRDPPVALTMETASQVKSHEGSRLPIVGDVMVLPCRLLGISGVLHASGTNPLRLALEQAAVEGTVMAIPGGTTLVQGCSWTQRAKAGRTNVSQFAPDVERRAGRICGSLCQSKMFWSPYPAVSEVKMDAQYDYDGVYGDGVGRGGLFYSGLVGVRPYWCAALSVVGDH